MQKLLAACCLTIICGGSLAIWHTLKAERDERLIATVYDSMLAIMRLSYSENTIIDPDKGVILYNIEVSGFGCTTSTTDKK